MSDMEKDEKEILLKNARILWMVEDGKILKVIVEEFAGEDKPKWLYDEYKYDIGNCLADWQFWTPTYILYHMFVRWEYTDLHAKERCMEQLLKIKEINEEFSKTFKKIQHYTL